MDVKLAVFDLAGTTVEDNNDVPRILQETLAGFDVFVSLEEAVRTMGIPKPVAIKKLISRHADPLFPVTNDLLDAIHETFQREMIAFYSSSPTLKEKEGVAPTFRKMKELGIRIAIDTGFDRSIAEVVLQRMGWSENGLIDFSVTSEEVPRGRPFPDMIWRAMEVLDVRSAKEVAKIGDTASDLQEGSSAGCGWVIGITSGAYTKDELAKEPHTHLVRKIPEILPILSFTSAPLNA